MTDGRGDGQRRSLLVNGEALRLDVSAPRAGGGDKYQPRSPAQARDLLLPQIRSVIQATHELPAEFRADQHLYVEARLLPNFISASDFPAALLSQIGAVTVGSRAVTGPYQTQTKVRDAGTRRLVLAVRD